MRRPRRRRSWLRDGLLAGAILAALALIAAGLDRRNRILLDGRAGIIDGDSLMLGGERIRLRGIDAPELGQTCQGAEGAYDCGKRARDALAELARPGPVRCEGWQRDRYRRLLGVCRSGDIELNARMVASGWAVSYGAYLREEQAAQAAQSGLWAGRFERPRQWRANRGALVELRHDQLGGMMDRLRALFPDLGGDNEE